ncbi:hypothetical protein [Halobacillus sp. BBL2006]|uniref:hypothetical protein n=1 Tax=Halobacillus sp. BBL2006 TaxID=1543706 RepID=UPI000541B7F1|nr:hypothetical protein [Halobacillus sp. BBL2006]KHE72237.1 hypothetical protein LD39_05590 [Halobacillus sp. BBL2006]
MELIDFLQNEGYSKLSFTLKNQSEAIIELNEVMTTNHLFEKLAMVPDRLEYYPFEAKPYLLFIIGTKRFKVYLQKNPTI